MSTSLLCTKLLLTPLIFSGVGRILGLFVSSKGRERSEITINAFSMLGFLLGIGFSAGIIFEKKCKFY